jgi:hypothetical protein
MAIENRIPAQKIVKGAPIILDVNSTDALFMDPSSYIGIKGGSLQTKYMSGFPSGVSGDGVISSGTPNETIPTVEITIPNPAKPGAEWDVTKLDVVSLTDIESVTYEEYYESGVAKYKCFIKIRNSSKNKNNVEGVDARIYNPFA